MGLLMLPVFDPDIDHQSVCADEGEGEEKGNDGLGEGDLCSEVRVSACCGVKR